MANDSKRVRKRRPRKKTQTITFMPNRETVIVVPKKCKSTFDLPAGATVETRHAEENQR